MIAGGPVRGRKIALTPVSRAIGRAAVGRGDARAGSYLALGRSPLHGVKAEATNDRGSSAIAATINGSETRTRRSKAC